MNLIGNCCISNFISKKVGEGNNNPFTWIDMDFDSLYYLMTNWENIDWNNFMLNKVKHPYQNCDLFEIVIEEKVHLRYIHYLYEKTALQPKVFGENVRYCKIWEYIVQKYEERLKRMLEQKENPVFITEWEHMNYDEAAFWKIEKEDLKYKLVVITYNKNLKTENKNILLIYDPHGRGGGYKGAGNRFPQWYANTYYNKIMEFIKNGKK